MINRTTVFFFSLFLISSAFSQNDFKPITEWKEKFPGVWTAKVGDPSVEQSWTALAAEPPRENALNALPVVDFPFANQPIEFIETDGRIGVSIPTAIDSKVYGLGLQLDGIDKTQDTFELKADHWGHGGGHSHAPTPFFITTDGYGIFFDTARYVRLRTHVSVRKDAEVKPEAIDRNPVGGFKEGMAKWTSMPKAASIEADMHAKGVRIFVISGKDPLDIVCRYNLLSGGGALPPLWGLGVWHRVPADFNAEETLKEISEFEDYDIPLDVIGLEPGWMTASYPCTFEWQKERFPDPKAFTQSLLEEKNIRLNIWENPYVAPSAKIYEPLLPYSGTHLVWNGLVPDLYLPEAVDILVKQHAEEHIDIGISGYKTDEVDGYDKWLWPDHAVFPSGVSAETMRQTLGTVYQKTYYDQLFKKRNQRTYALVRSMGGAASAHPSVLYTDAYDHLQFITGISAASLGGLLWCPEIRSAENELEWVRRSQSVAFSPMAKINAWSSGKKPWSYGKTGTAGVREAFQLRLRLLPYLYSAFADYHKKGIPPFRAMILENGAEREVETIEGELDSEKNPYAEATRIAKDDQYMMGANILVAPYYKEFSKKRDVFLPRGKWYDFYTGKLVSENGGKISVEGEKTPLFVKGGAIIPMIAETINNTREAYGADLEVRLYGEPWEEMELWIYEDDGKTFNYLEDGFRYRILSFDKELVMEERLKGDGPALYGKVKEVKRMGK